MKGGDRREEDAAAQFPSRIRLHKFTSEGEMEASVDTNSAFSSKDRGLKRRREVGNRKPIPMWG